MNDFYAVMIMLSVAYVMLAAILFTYGVLEDERALFWPFLLVVVLLGLVISLIRVFYLMLLNGFVKTAKTAREMLHGAMYE